MRQPFKSLLIAAFVIVCLGALSLRAYYTSAGPLPTITTIVIPKGTGFLGIAALLAEEGVIRLPLLFQASAVLAGNGRNFKAGEYEFPASISPQLVMQALLEGRTVVHKFTVAEGLRSREVITMLLAEPLLSGGVPVNVSEGVLLPETYFYSYGDDRTKLLARMQRDHDSFLTEQWEKRDTSIPVKTPKEAVILASIVERETGIAAERPRVAAVYINRLRIGMKLQADPTVIYGIMEEDGIMERPLTRADLQRDTPYNTYTRTGLPPGPIANPGKDAMKAVLNPPATKELYFVADGKGGHNFAVSGEEHNRNVAAYRAAVKAQQ